MSYQPKTPLGQATMANSDPVVIASDQSAVPVSGTVTANLSATDNAVLDAIAASVDTIDSVDFATQTTLAAIKAKTDNIPAQGQALAAASTPVVLTAAQITTLTPPAAITGYATSAKQDTLDTSVNTLLKPASTLAAVTSITNVVHVDDNASSLTIDNSTLTSLAAAINSSKVDVNIASGSASGTEYVEDAASTANPSGGALIVVREDARAGGLTTADGDNVAVRGNNKGEMYVKTTDSDALLTTIDTDTSNISTKIDTIAGAVSGTEVQVDVLTMPTTAVTNAGITTIAGAVSGTEMQVDVLTMPTVTVTATNLDVQSGGADLATTTQAGAIQTSVELIDDAVYTDGTGTVTKGIAILGQDGTNPQAIKTDASGELQVDVLSMPTTAVTGTFWQATQPVSLTSTTVTGTVAVTQSGTWDEVGINDSGNSITVDYATTGSGTATGALRVELPTNGTGTVGLNAGTNNIGDVDIASIAAGDNNIGNVDIVSGTVTTVTTLTGGGVAHDSADSGNPVKIGGQARTTNPTAVADADRANFITDKLGKQVVVGSIRDLKANQVTTITSSTSETTIVTAVASTFLDMYGLIISNTSATAVNVAIKDATAGTTRFNLSVPAGDTRGFMLPEGGAIKQSAVNNNWTATSSASVSSLVITALTVANT